MCGLSRTVPLQCSSSTVVLHFLDVRVTNLDAPSIMHRKPEAVLVSQEREKEEEIPPSLSS